MVGCRTSRSISRGRRRAPRVAPSGRAEVATRYAPNLEKDGAASNVFSGSNVLRLPPPRTQSRSFAGAAGSVSHPGGRSERGGLEQALEAKCLGSPGRGAVSRAKLQQQAAR